MAKPSSLYRMIEDRLAGTLADFVAARRATSSWAAIAAEVREATQIEVSYETLRLWFVDRIQVEVRVAPDAGNPPSPPAPPKAPPKPPRPKPPSRPPNKPPGRADAAGGEVAA